MTEKTDQAKKQHPLVALIRKLDKEGELHHYALACKTSDKYLRNHIQRKSRTPRRRLMWALADNSEHFGQAISREEVIAFFLASEEAPTN